MHSLSPRNAEAIECATRIKFTSPIGGIQQADAPEAAAKKVRPTPCFTFG